METNNVITDSFETLSDAYGNSVLDGLQGVVNSFSTSNLSSAILDKLVPILAVFLTIIGFFVISRYIYRAISAPSGGRGDPGWS